ncbi:unnamed protein product [Enterobius vermicularis]|uniref:cardiolipin synthase (CMP-forming) n=1 Tax=Enterobius vermicularis TaxID=51028 RepID=A0A0N4V5V5_ENTVE|nr:unnamed protein product [Enterobius vermicularis]
MLESNFINWIRRLYGFPIKSSCHGLVGKTEFFFFRSFSRELAEKSPLRRKIMTVPNALCFFRMGITPFIGYLVITHYFGSACCLLVIAGLTDLLDGYIARHMRGQSSSLGSIIDPVADKVLVTTMFLTLTYVNLIPVVLTTLVVLRDLGLVTGGFLKRFKMLPPPVTLKRFFDSSITPFQVTPTFLSKVNTALQLTVVTFSLAAPVFAFTNHSWLSYLYLMTGITTVSSGMQYVILDRMKRL